MAIQQFYDLIAFFLLINVLDHLFSKKNMCNKNIAIIFGDYDNNVAIVKVNVRCLCAREYFCKESCVETAVNRQRKFAKARRGDGKIEGARGRQAIKQKNEISCVPYPCNDLLYSLYVLQAANIYHVIRPAK